MILIDGRGAGGQILRTVLGLSVIMGQSLKVINIRKGKPGGAGLKTQHLEGVLAIAQLCNAEIIGATLGSTEIEFFPKGLEPKELNIRISTAGSIGLLFQSLQIPSAFTNGIVKINVKGGSTASAWSPPLHYSQNVFLPIVGKMGYKAEIKILKEGFYPKGGAEVEIIVHPIKKLNAIRLTERGEIKEINGISIAGKLPEHVAKRQANAAKKVLLKHGFNADVKAFTVDTASPGTSITLWAECANSIIGADALGKRGKPAEQVGSEAAEDLIRAVQSSAALDKYMADQILCFLALSSSESKVTVEKITDHCLTNIRVIEKMLPVKFKIIGERDQFGEISIKGMGFENKLLK